MAIDRLTYLGKASPSVSFAVNSQDRDYQLQMADLLEYLNQNIETTDVSDLRAELANNVDPNLGAGMIGYKGRNLYQRAGDVLSVRDYIGTAIDGVTSNQAGIVAAVAAAKAAGATLYWPAGTYVSTASIPDFHTISHYGDGIIKRGTDTFKMNQSGGQRNIIYVATTGSDLNDGLSAAQPFATIQAAATAVLFNWEENMLLGAWRLQLAAGTYGRATVLRAVKCAERFQVFGPEANWGQPTAIIDNLLFETDTFGLYLNTLDRWQVKDIFFKNFTGTQGIGVSASNSSDFYCTNVWADNCGWAGIYMQSGDIFRVEGGKITNCREGVVAYTGVTFTIGYNSSLHPTIIQNCTQSGFTAYNSSSGHVDYAEITACNVNVSIINQSRVDFAGAKLMGGNVGIGADSSSTYIKNTDEAVLFNSGAPNTLNERCRGFSLPNDYMPNYTFTPSSRVMRWGAAWSAASPVSTYKFVFEQQAGDSGIALLSSGTELGTLAFGRSGSGAAGRLSYDHATDTFRIVNNNSNNIFISSTAINANTDNTMSFGIVSRRFSNVFGTNIRPGAGAVTWTSGAGTPEGSVTAVVGSMYTRTDGGANTTLYIKETGTGNTGWVAK